MNSSMIGKIEKAHRYANEKDRVRFSSFEATIHGDNSEYQVTLSPDGWNCSCHTFQSHALETCGHVMALQLILGKMLDEETRYTAQTERMD